MKSRAEKEGEWFMMIQILLNSFYPILLHEGGEHIPGLQFLAYTTLLGIPLYLGTSVFRKELGELKNFTVWPYLLGVTFFISIIPFALIFMAAGETSGINIALLLQSELLFTTLFAAFIGEALGPWRMFGILAVLLGNIFVLFNGAGFLNKADLILFLAPAFFPLGNFFAKKAMQQVSWSTVLLFRTTLGGGIIFILALMFETWVPLNSRDGLILLLFGLGTFGLGRIFWSLALHRLALNKTVALGMTAPGLSLIWAVLLLREVPSLYQWLGITFIACGFYFILKMESKPVTVSA